VRQQPVVADDKPTQQCARTSSQFVWIQEVRTKQFVLYILTVLQQIS